MGQGKHQMEVSQRQKLSGLFLQPLPVALSNNRILKVQNGQITLSYRGRTEGTEKRPLPSMPRNLFAAFCFTSRPMASCGFATSAFWPAAVKKTRWLNVAKFWGYGLPCLNQKKNPPANFYSNSLESILVVAPAA